MMHLSNLKKILPIFIIIFVIITLVILIIIPTQINQNSDSKTDQTTTQIEKPSSVYFPPREAVKNLPKNVQEIRREIISAPIADNRGDLLLHQSNSFKIEYIPSLDIFYVKISEEPPKTYKQQAEKWFLDFGLEQSHLCDFSLRFILDFRLKKTNPNFSSFASGCN